jgi:hypothetical protein
MQACSSFIADWNPLIIEGNRVRLTRVFTTFLMSAAKCTEPGSTIRVSAVSTTVGWRRVWDTGRECPAIPYRVSIDSLPTLEKGRTAQELGCWSRVKS